MNREQEEALEAAKLAAMVGGQLKTIDQYSVSRGSAPPANKINIESFAAKVKNPKLKISPARYLTESAEGFVSLPENLVQNQVPDTSVGSSNNIQQTYVPEPYVPSEFHVKPEPHQFISPIITTSNTISNRENSSNDKNTLTRSDIDSFRNSLKNIDKTLVAMLSLLKDKNSK
jgi:hypothetical protein